jgi:hypothetical protein
VFGVLGRVVFEAKILRRDLLYDRHLLHDLSRCAWESLKAFILDVTPERNPLPGAVIAVQTFGDFLGFNPHCHILITDGCFCGKGMLRVVPLLELKKLEAIFRHEILQMLIAKVKITQEMLNRSTCQEEYCVPCESRQNKFSK